MNVLFDSTVLIDCLQGLDAAKRTIQQYPGSPISIISWIEVLTGAKDAAERDGLKAFLLSFVCLPLDDEIAEAAAILRRERKLKLPDAVILATAQNYDATLITRNTRDFPENTPGIRIPYRV